MLFLMGVLALLFITPNANADDKEKYNSLRRKREKKSGHWNCLNLPTRLFPKIQGRISCHSGCAQPVRSHQKDPFQRWRLSRRISLYRP